MKHLVICGPPNSGKSTRAVSEARNVDLIYDFDKIHTAMMVGGERIRGELIAARAFDVLVSLRDFFVQRMRTIPPDECRAIVTVVDRHSAERIAGVLDAELIDLGA